MLWAGGSLPLRKGRGQGPEAEEGANAPGLLLENNVTKCQGNTHRTTETTIQVVQIGTRVVCVHS